MGEKEDSELECSVRDMCFILKQDKSMCPGDVRLCQYYLQAKRDLDGIYQKLR